MSSSTRCSRSALPGGSTCFVVLTLLAGTGCTKHLPPPPRPPAVMPLGEAPPEGDASMARVTIGTDVPAIVEREVGYEDAGPDGTARRIVWETLCQGTPCTVTLAYGEHKLHFTGLSDRSRKSTAVVHVNARSEVVNHTLGHERSSTGTAVGAAIVAMSILAIGLPHGFDLEVPKAASQILLVAGIGGIFSGACIMGLFPNTTQDGATTQWSPLPASEPRAARGASLRLSF